MKCYYLNVHFQGQMVNVSLATLHIKSPPYPPAIQNCAVTLTKHGYILDPVICCQHYRTNTETHGKTKFWIVM